MGDVAGQFIVFCWAAFLIFWFVASFSAKRTIERTSGGWRLVPLLVALALTALRSSDGAFAHLAGTTLWRDTLTVEIVADVLTAAGLAIMLWARVTLGGNWSGNVV